VKKKISRIPDIPSMPTFGKKFSYKDRTPQFMLIVLLACFVVLAVWLDSRDFEKDRAECMDSVNKSREKGLIVPSGKPVTPKDTGSCTNKKAGVLSVRLDLFSYYF
jgi:hypothetical protein